MHNHPMVILPYFHYFCPFLVLMGFEHFFQHDDDSVVHATSLTMERKLQSCHAANVKNSILSFLHCMFSFKLSDLLYSTKN